MSESRKRDRAPYLTRRFLAYKAVLKADYFVCWVRDENGKCWRRGTIPDHVPPLAMVPDRTNWQGELRPMCAYHSRKQSGMIRQGKTYRPAPSRQW